MPLGRDRAPILAPPRPGWGWRLSRGLGAVPGAGSEEAWT